MAVVVRECERCQHLHPKLSKKHFLLLNENPSRLLEMIQSSLRNTYNILDMLRCKYLRMLSAMLSVFGSATALCKGGTRKS